MACLSSCDVAKLIDAVIKKKQQTTTQLPREGLFFRIVSVPTEGEVRSSSMSSEEGGCDVG